MVMFHVDTAIASADSDSASASAARKLRTRTKRPTNKPAEVVQTASNSCTTSCSAGPTCTPTVDQQVCIELYDPVCGCDGREYSNECFAFRAGVNVASTGSC